MSAAREDVGEGVNAVREGEVALQVEPGRSREKGASLLHMIPLERWNLAPWGQSSGKVTKTRLPIPRFTPLIG